MKLINQIYYNCFQFFNLPSSFSYELNEPNESNESNQPKKEKTNTKEEKVEKLKKMYSQYINKCVKIISASILKINKLLKDEKKVILIKNELRKVKRIFDLIYDFINLFDRWVEQIARHSLSDGKTGTFKMRVRTQMSIFKMLNFNF